ncbi:Protein phosphatase 1 regulatory subunit 7 [Glycine soja]
MARLSSDQVLKDNNAADPTSVTTLHLTHKALSDITCLANFVNLEKLDLKLNNLTSLEGLRSCVNLKWLSVVENKLESLEGIQGLTKLTVLNAENEISSICKLDQLKDLNTLVLSKNPIRKIGEALMKVKSITKLSLSYCELQGIGTSLKSCVELSELRLAHNEIKSLPAELKLNSKLRSLDLGNNVITRWSELKVLELLTNLRNLNLQGNPAATVNKVMRKIKKALSKLQIFNARPVDKDTENKKGSIVDGTRDFSVDQNENDHIEAADDLDSGRKSSKKRKRTVDASKKEDRVVDEENKGHKKDKADRKKESLITNVDPGMENKSTKKKAKKDDKPLDKGFALEENVSKVEKKLKKQHKNDEQSELDVIDDAEASFAELFKINDAENLNLADEMKAQDKVPKDVMKLAGDPVTSFAKHKNAKIQNMESLSAPVAEIGMGGPSTWGDEL